MLSSDIDKIVLLVLLIIPILNEIYLHLFLLPGSSEKETQRLSKFYRPLFNYYSLIQEIIAQRT